MTPKSTELARPSASTLTPATKQIEQPEEPLQLPLLRATAIEHEVFHAFNCDPSFRRRIFLRPAGDGTARYQANLPGGELVTAEASTDDQIALKIESTDRLDWVPIMIFESAAPTTRGIRLTRPYQTKGSGNRSYSMAADGGDDGSVALRGKIDAGYVYELNADHSFVKLAATLYNPSHQEPPKAMELRLRSNCDSQWDELSLMRKIPSKEVSLSTIPAGSLPKKVARLWVMLKQKSPLVRKLATVFTCPDQTQADDWMSLILYSKDIASFLPRPGQGYLLRGVDDRNFVTQCRVRHARPAGSVDAGAGFFVTLARRNYLSGEIARHAHEAKYKWRVSDPHVRENLRQEAASNLVEQVFKGRGNVVMTDDADGKAAYTYVAIRNNESKSIAKARRNRETPFEEVSDFVSPATIDCPLVQLAKLESYNRAIELLQSIADSTHLLAVLHKLESGCTWAEAAQAFDVPQGTIRSLMCRFRSEWNLRFASESG